MVTITKDGKLLTERDTLKEDGTIDWRAVRTIAMVRGLAERDREICIAAYGPCLKLPVGIGFHNVAAWRADRAAKALADNPTLLVTPILKLYRAELRQVWTMARILQRARLRLMDDLRASVAFTIIASPDTSGAAPAACAWCAYYEGRELVGPYGFGPTADDARNDLTENYDIPGVAA